MKKEILKQMIEDGLTQRQIAKKTGKSHSSIRYWLKKFDLKTKHRSIKEGPPQRLLKCHLCKFCGTNNPNKFGGRHKTMCTTCLNRYYRLKKKIKCVEYKGGKCEICGYDKEVEVFDFHHLDPKEKDFNISSTNRRGRSTISWDKLKKELDKCILLCANCHREIHAKEKDRSIYLKFIL